MPRYRTTDVESGQGLFLTVNLQDQLLPGTYEHMLNEIIGKEIDLSIFDSKYKNEHTGASAVPPCVLLKLIMYAYSKGCKSSRKISELNQNNIVAKALTGDMNIHWTTIADFISGNREEFADVFVKVLMYCNELELIGGETEAVDGLRLPSNASIEMSGTKEELEERLERCRKAAKKHLDRHEKNDALGEVEEEEKKRFEERQKQLSKRIENISNFLNKMEPKQGKNGKEIKSNVTDNDSAMIHSSKGIIQGYIGQAVTDSRNQIIVGCQAVGSSNEGEHLQALLDKTAKDLKEAGVGRVKEAEGVKEAGEASEEKKKSLLADANYFSEDNLRACDERGIEAIIPDGQHKRRLNAEGQKRFEVPDFNYNEEGNYYECPNGKKLEYKSTKENNGDEEKVYQASTKDCKACPLFSKCSWSKKEQGTIKQGKTLKITKTNKPGNLGHKMREKLSTDEYQALYSRRIQIVEPVFSNIGYCKWLNRFMLRGSDKVNGQWTLYCIVHNLGKCVNWYNGNRKSA